MTATVERTTAKGALAQKQAEERASLLIAARRTQKPLPFAASLPTFHCMCAREHKHLADSRDVIACGCGRSWVPIGGSA